MSDQSEAKTTFEQATSMLAELIRDQKTMHDELNAIRDEQRALAAKVDAFKNENLQRLVGIESGLFRIEATLRRIQGV